MNDMIKDYINQNKDTIIQKKEFREKEIDETIVDLLVANKEYTEKFNAFFFKIIKLGVIEAKKRFYNGRYNGLPKKDKFNYNSLSEVKTYEAYKEHVYKSSFCDAYVYWTNYVTKEPLIHISINSFDINSIDFYKNEPNNLDSNQIGYYNSFCGFIERDQLKAIIKYNNERTNSQIMTLPFNWSDNTKECKSWERYYHFFILQLEEYEKLGLKFMIDPNKRTISMDISMYELESMIRTILSGKAANYKMDVLKYIEPISDIIHKFLYKGQTYKELGQICKKNFESFSLQVYKKLLKKHIDNTEIYDDEDYEIYINLGDESKITENKELYEDFLLTTSYNEDPNRIIYVSYKDDDEKKPNERYVPVLLSDIKELVNELDGEFQLKDNELIIKVNSVKFENLLLNVSNEKEKSL